MISIDPEAADEIDEAADIYAAVGDVLHNRFWDEVATTLGRVEESPKLFAPDEDGVRVASLERFPYAVFFTIEIDRTVVWAFMHHKRNPGYWKYRRS